MPSMEMIVVFGSISLNPCNACAMHSHPARVERAYWNGAVSDSTASLNCWAIVRATNRVAPPSGLLRAVILPNRMASTIGCGTMLRARPSPLGQYNNGRKCSTVTPESKPAIPRLADLKFFKNMFSSNSNGTVGTCSRTSCGMGSRSL